MQTPKQSQQTIAPDILLERHVPVVMPDGVRLFANIFRPAASGRYPAILSVTPYGKDLLPDRKTMFFMRLAGVQFGTLRCSRWTGFESPDPLYWVGQGYVVGQADVRGMHSSEGSAGILTDLDAADYATFIEWAAVQPWCNGKVGLLGVSYLAMSQWRVAALQPPALRAICPWEGVTDMLRELAYQDGIPETRFIPTWWGRIVREHNRHFSLGEDFPADAAQHPLDDEHWAKKRPELHKITVPALVCASWSDHGLHTRGSFIGFEEISSKEKWLYTHGRRKWETFYSQEACAIQTAFFAYTLKDQPEAMNTIPPLRLERRRSFYQADVRNEPRWPLQNVQAQQLHLSASPNALTEHAPQAPSMAEYDSTHKDDRAQFFYTFKENTEITGGMALKLWVSCPDSDDLDLFVTLHKMDQQGNEVYFSGYNGFRRDCVAKGWLRASHRQLDVERSTLFRPWHSHRERQFIQQGDIVAVDIEILPSSTFFEAGTTLRLDIQGGDAAQYPAFGHKQDVNRGRHRIHCGANYDSRLTAPIILKAN